MNVVNWKRGLDRLYSVLWGIWGVTVGVQFFSDGSFRYFESWLLVFGVVIVAPLLLKYAVKWIYKGFYSQH